MNPRDILTTIIPDGFRDQEQLGRYNIQFHNHSVKWDGIEYMYHSSGLCRTVYISPDRTFVLKLPNEDRGSIQQYLETGLSLYMDVYVAHNVYEAQCYQEAPEEYKQYMAKTELLPNGWVKQEFVEVLECPLAHNFHEVGKIDNRYVLFDFDVMLDQFSRPWEGYHYDVLPKWMEEAKQLVERTNT